MSSSVKFKPRMPKEPGVPKATQTVHLPNGGYRVEDATIEPVSGKERPVLLEYKPAKSKPGAVRFKDRRRRGAS